MSNDRFFEEDVDLKVNGEDDDESLGNVILSHTDLFDGLTDEDTSEEESSDETVADEESESSDESVTDEESDRESDEDSSDESSDESPDESSDESSDDSSWREPSDDSRRMSPRELRKSLERYSHDENADLSDINSDSPCGPENFTEVVDEMDRATSDQIYDRFGNPINTQIAGQIELKVIRLSDIVTIPSTRIDMGDIDGLAASIDFWGLVDPLHVAPYVLGGEQKYILLHGRRRMLALSLLDKTTSLAIVDYTRPKQTFKFLEVIFNNSKQYNFLEHMSFGEFVERKQQQFRISTIETMLGMQIGDYEKSKRIMEFGNQDYIKEIISNKKTITQIYRKIEKDLAEKASVENLSTEELMNRLEQFVEKAANVQTTKDRSALSIDIVRRVRTRDEGRCRSCFIGGSEGEELNVLFETHHMVPVAKGGSDADENLITLCANCHKAVTAYIDGRFSPPESRRDSYYNIILLGNIGKMGTTENMTANEIYNKKCRVLAS